MADIKSDNSEVRRLVDLIDSGALPPDDEEMAHLSLRRLTQPLRMIVLGSDAAHAIGLLNLLSGRPIGLPRGDRVRVQCVYAAKDIANVDYRDGASRVFGPDQFRTLFAENPVRLKIGIDTPATRKLSMMVATDSDTDKLCQAMEQTLLASDIALIAGREASPPVMALWSRMPDRLRHHSYLTLAPGIPGDGWSTILDDFAAAIAVDPRAALAAKSRESGVDKEAFRASGGAALVKAIRRELELLPETARDAMTVLLARYGSGEPSATGDAERQEAGAERAPETLPPDDAAPETIRRPPERTAGAGQRDAPPAQPPAAPDQPASGDKAPRSETPRADGGTAAGPDRQPPGTDAPKKLRSKPSSDRKRPTATPWSLDL